MMYKMSDVLNFLGKVVYIQFNDSCIVETVNDWLNEYGNIKVDVVNVIEHHNGTKTVVINR